MDPTATVLAGFSSSSTALSLQTCLPAGIPGEAKQFPETCQTYSWNHIILHGIWIEYTYMCIPVYTWYTGIFTIRYSICIDQRHLCTFSRQAMTPSWWPMAHIYLGLWASTFFGYRSVILLIFHTMIYKGKLMHFEFYEKQGMNFRAYRIKITYYFFLCPGKCRFKEWWLHSLYKLEEST